MSGDLFPGLENHQDYPEILVVISYLSLFSVAGTLGNAFVFYVYSKKTDKSTTTIFILTLALTDFFSCLIIIPFTLYYEIMAKRINNDYSCKLLQFLITSNIPFSAFIMVLIAFDRYFKICRPYNQCLDIRVSKRIIFFLFLIAVSLGIITSLTHGVNPIKNNTDNLQNASTYMNYTNQTAGEMYERNNVVSTSFQPDTNSTKRPTSPGSPSDGYCMPSYEYLDEKFIGIYQNVYASLFLISWTFVTILYGLIFRTIIVRRAKKYKRTARYQSCGRRASEFPHTVTTTATTRLTTAENGDIETTRVDPNNTESNNRSVKNKLRIANIKTAGILFIVTTVFIVAFLPAWLMAHKLIPGDIIVFYLHFVYNVANPIIYAFFNETFRKDVKKTLNCKR